MLIDCNASFGHWPFARFAEDTPARLAALFRKEGVGRALVSSADAILFQDPEECNRDLAARLARRETLLPVPVANPRVASWPDAVGRAGIRAVKLIPNYHNYGLLDPRSLALAEAVAAKGLPLLVQMRVEDERSHHELLKVKGVPPEDIAGLASRFPRLRIVALCPYFAEAATLGALPNVWVDISFAEILDTVRRLREKVPAERILFGSHAPFFTVQAAVMKVHYASVSDREKELIGNGNAEALFGISAGD